MTSSQRHTRRTRLFSASQRIPDPWSTIRGPPQRAPMHRTHMGVPIWLRFCPWASTAMGVQFGGGSDGAVCQLGLSLPCGYARPPCVVLVGDAHLFFFLFFFSPPFNKIRRSRSQTPPPSCVLIKSVCLCMCMHAYACVCKCMCSWLALGRDRQSTYIPTLYHNSRPCTTISLSKG